MTGREPLYFHWRCGSIRGFWSADAPPCSLPGYAPGPGNAGQIVGFVSALRSWNFHDRSPCRFGEISMWRSWIFRRWSFQWKWRGPEPGGDRFGGSSAAAKVDMECPVACPNTEYKRILAESGYGRSASRAGRCALRGRSNCPGIYPEIYFCWAIYSAGEILQNPWVV